MVRSSGNLLSYSGISGNNYIIANSVGTLTSGSSIDSGGEHYYPVTEPKPDPPNHYCLQKEGDQAKGTDSPTQRDSDTAGGKWAHRIA